MKKFFIFLLTLGWLFSGCAQMQIHKSKSKDFRLKKSDTIAVVPFINLTQTPLAGYNAASIGNVILQNHGFKTKPMKLKPDPDEIFNENKFDKSKLLNDLTDTKIAYILSGKVTEWRYKSGIDAEPIVGLIIELTDTKSSKVIYSATGSKNGSARSSISNLSQEILDKILP